MSESPVRGGGRYVSCGAPGSRWDVAMEFRVDGVGDSDGDGDSDGAAEGGEGGPGE